MGVGTHRLGPGVWDHHVWELGPWVFGTNLDHCVGIMGVWDQPSGTTVWDHVWDHRLGPWVFGTTVWAWVFWTIGVSNQPLGH